MTQPSISPHISARIDIPRPVRVAAGAAVFVVSVRSLTRNAQPTRAHRIALKTALGVEVAAAVSVSRMDRRLVAGAVPVRPERSPAWHTAGHVVLRCDVDDFTRRPAARLVHVGKGECRMVVNHAFLAAADETQRSLYNAALDVPARTRHLPLSATVNSVGLLANAAVRHALVDERGTVSKQRAVTVLLLAQVGYLARRHIARTLVDSREPVHVRA